MINIIHYEDDIFYLTSMVKRLGDGVKLELDTSLFLNKILEDIAFISRSIEFFLESLKTSKLKVNRLNYLKNIYKLNKIFIEMLTTLITEQVAFAAQVSNHMTHLSSVRNKHFEHERTIIEALNKGKKPDGEESDMLSEEEYRILLSNDENS